MWRNPQETADLVIFTEEILNEKLPFLCSESRNSTDHFNFIVKVNHLGEDYLKIPLVYCTNYFWSNFDRETKPFYMVISTWWLIVVANQNMLIRPNKTT